MPVKPGQVLAGDKYRVEHVLGVGGMGVVVAATHLQLHQPVAIKFMLRDAAADPESVERFLREARNAALLKSEHVARVLDVATLEDGSPYIVMELLEGATADELAANGHVLSVGEAVKYTTQVCEAVAEAHARGIIHRDLKLANLFLTSSTDKRALVKVIDFGLSRPIDPESRRITKDMSIMGTPSYMSPEQLRAGADVDTRTDLWALGVVLFELLTGEVPFGGGSAPEICARVLTEEPRDVRALRPEVPEGVAFVIARCLQKDRDARFANVAELAEALDPFVPDGSARPGDRVRRVQSENVMAPVFKSSTHHDVSSKRTGLSWGADGLVPKQSYRGWIALTGAVAVLAVVVLFFAFRAIRSPDEAPSATSPPPPTASDPATPTAPGPSSATAPTPSGEAADPSATAPGAPAGARDGRPLRPAPRPPAGGVVRPRVPKKDNILDSR